MIMEFDSENQEFMKQLATLKSFQSEKGLPQRIFNNITRYLRNA
jgi:CRP-like cAMP-binding protein